jgi:hypothetical protein
MDSASISIGVFTLFESDSDVDVVGDNDELIPFESPASRCDGSSLICLESCSMSIPFDLILKLFEFEG